MKPKHFRVFGVTTILFHDELFWGGDRIDMLIERIKTPGVGRHGTGQPASEVMQQRLPC